MFANFTLFRKDPIHHARTPRAERCHGVTNGSAFVFDADRAESARERHERFGQNKSDHPPMTAAFTQQMLGSASEIADQLAPSSLLANNFPLRVPK